MSSVRKPVQSSRVMAEEPWATRSPVSRQREIRDTQRQPAHHGASHSTLLGNARRGLAMKYLSDATAFHRAFKRWTGEAPAH